MTDLGTSIQLREEALDTMAADHPDRARQLYNLGVQYRDQYLKFGATTDLEKAIRRSQEAVDITPRNHPACADRLNALGIVYHDRYARNEEGEDLDISIQRVQEALDIMSADDPSRDNRLFNLGFSYRERFLKFGTMTDLETAFQRFQEALAITPKNHPKRADRLAMLGAVYHDRYKRKGNREDLDNAMQRLEEALNITPEDHPHRGIRLQDLGIWYRIIYEDITGAKTDIDRAIELCQEACNITPTDHPDRARRLYNLGAVYLKRYGSIKAEADLEVAMKRLKEALDITPRNDSQRALRLQDLGAAYQDRYMRKRVNTDLEECIRLSQEALNSTSTNDPQRASRLRDLGNHYTLKYQKTEEIKNIDKAISFFKEALQVTPEDDPSRAHVMESLGIAYRNRYGKTKMMDDFKIACQYSQKVFDITSTDDPHRANRLRHLAVEHQNRYEETGAMTDFESATRLLEEALDHSLSPILDRASAGFTLFFLYAKNQNWPQAFEAGSKMVSIFSLLTPNYLEIRDMQYVLTYNVEWSSEVSAIALNAGKTPFDAIQVLEIGRGVIIGSLNEIRIDIFDLQQKHPHLAEEYNALRNQLDVPSLSTNRDMNQRSKSSQELERKIQQIRQLPDFDRFLLPPSEEELKTIAEHGPVVIINVSDYRCDALIIEKMQIRTLPLSHLNKSDIQDRARESIESSVNPETLEWLWETIAQPVLDTLGFIQTPSDDHWPHICWIPTGPLAKFPIHAAGYHSEGSFRNVLDLAISSYSSSTKTFFHGCRQRSQITMTPRSENIILVAMPKTPNMKNLPFVTEEIDELTKLWKPKKLQVMKPSPYKEPVLSALNDCEIFHFAGHGLTHGMDPLKSQLILEDWETEPLTVARLFETNLRKQKPFLAYLSACGTGQIKQDGLVDESLHLISACQIAGFRHVIGTLWQVDDKSCVDMAVKTYEWMQRKKMSDRSVSEGLHHASRALRNQWIKDNSTREALIRDRGVQNTASTVPYGLPGVVVTHVLSFIIFFITLIARTATRGGQMALNRSHPTQGEAENTRDAGIDDDKEFSPLYWVPFVHYGV